ncbi:MAG: right-handed parallel beta-helix repeat-containing protein [Gammaproteobacteria bacterium]|nr:right-handed parallel beta-helix repeat-containing protein [Gammaproteobacteria bacterium]
MLMSGCGQDLAAPDFPTDGGNDGKVIRVTHLGNAGPGSPRAALSAQLPRLVIFDVAGVIDLEGEDLEIDAPHLTLAGETAPEPGITLIRGGIRVRSHDVEINHLRVRPGDAGREAGSGWMPDGISVEGPQGHHVRVSHCSLTWAVDENLSATGPEQGPTSHDILFHDNLIAEGLRASTHPEGPHSMGTLIHDHVLGVVMARNLFAHNRRRNPRFKQGARGLVINNVIHNPGAEAVFLGPSRGAKGVISKTEPAHAVIVGNVLLPGPDSPRNLALVSGSGRVHLDDNLHLRSDGSRGRIATDTLEDANLPVEAPAGLERLGTAATLDHVLNQAGARPWARDATDQRIIDSVRARSGHIIDSQNAVGGYPDMVPRRRVLEVPVRARRAWLASLVPAPQQKTPRP